jgi:hypothetical protein
MPSTYTLISSNVLSTTAASVTFSAIPSTYTDLVVRYSGRSDSAGTSDRMRIYINGDTSSTLYSGTNLTGNGTAAASGRDSNDTGSILGSLVASTATASTFSNGEIYLPNYLVSANKPYSDFGVTENNATAAAIRLYADLWRNTAAITSFQLVVNSGSNFVSGSSFYLYGIKNS